MTGASPGELWNGVIRHNEERPKSLLRPAPTGRAPVRLPHLGPRRCGNAGEEHPQTPLPRRSRPGGSSSAYGGGGVQGLPERVLVGWHRRGADLQQLLLQEDDAHALPRTGVPSDLILDGPEANRDTTLVSPLIEPGHLLSEVGRRELYPGLRLWPSFHTASALPIAGCV